MKSTMMKEQLSGHTNVNEQENSLPSGKKIIDNEKIEGTPFYIITIHDEEEKKCFISVGNKRVTEIITREEADAMIKHKFWDLIVSLIAIVTEATMEEKIKNELQTVNDNYIHPAEHKY